MSEENLEMESLEALAERIVQCANEADEKAIEAAILIRQARDRVNRGDAGKITWTKWASVNIKLSKTRLRELHRIAKAEDPRQELKRQRDLAQKRAAKFREKQKAKKAAALQGSGDESVKAPANPEIGQTAPSKAKSEPGDGRLEEQGEAPSLRNGGDGASVADPEGGDHRERLIKWAEDAPPEKIEKVWAFVQSLDRAASGSETKEVAAPAAA